MDKQAILHATSREAWHQAIRRGEYQAESLMREGFIHCSTSEQIVATLRRYYSGEPDLVLLSVDPSLLASGLSFESSPSLKQAFPHIYGGINLDAVRQALFLSIDDITSGSFLDRIDRTGLEPIWIRALKMDGSRHWEHRALLASSNASMTTTRTRSGQQVSRADGPFTSVFNTTGYYWPDRWFNVIRLEEPTGSQAGCYCSNIVTPPRIGPSVLRYVDLQLDVRIFVEGDDLKCSVLDEDEFEAAREKYGYSDELVRRCRSAVDDIITSAQKRDFPFSKP